MPETAELELTLHGNRVRYLMAGSGPAVVLVHGITSSADTWADAMRGLAREHTVIAPDLLGHGASAKPRGDYSLGAYASGIRDLLARARPRPRDDRRPLARRRRRDAVRVPVPRAHRAARARLDAAGWAARSACSCAPRRCRAPSRAPVPGPGLARPRGRRRRLVRARGSGCAPRPDLEEIVRGFLSLGDAEARAAFMHTLRAVIDPGGQRVSGHDRLYLASNLPTLLVWGERDPIIPVTHARAAHTAMPGARLEIFPASGHFPHMDDTVALRGRAVRLPRDDRAGEARSRLAAHPHPRGRADRGMMRSWSASQPATAPATNRRSD